MKLTKEEIQELLNYDPETGIFHWKYRDVKWFSDGERITASWAQKAWNKRYANKEAFTCTEAEGYKSGSILGVACKAHRIAFLYMTGRYPYKIDHNNGIRSDNRWSNLKEVCNTGNARNHKLRKDNPTGHPGVTIYKTKNSIKYRVVICGEHLAVCDSLEEAISLRKKAEISTGFNPNHGRLL